jgi:hypothetical protein
MVDTTGTMGVGQTAELSVPFTEENLVMTISPALSTQQRLVPGG